VPGYDATSWTGVAVRAGTPKAICDKIEADTKIIARMRCLRSVWPASSTDLKLRLE
jgi:hypothetical protein